MSDTIFAGVKMPQYDGPEPSELELKRIEKALQEDRFNELGADQQRWVTRRLLPSLTRFGMYPPPQGTEG